MQITEGVMKKAMIAMSGGVDSSVAAKLMQDAGYECIGATMRLLGQDIKEDVAPEADPRSCCSLDDVEDARQAAFRLGMRHVVFNFSDDFSKQVIGRFVDAYERGETPNPCIDCNRYLKFERLLVRAMELGCEVIATGHYARTAYDPVAGRWQLLRALNIQKDQSYVLCHLTQEQLAHTVFPLGSCGSKDEVREIAQRCGFRNARKHDSQDICFVPDGDYASFIRRFTGKEYPEGDFTDTDGRVLGRHKGMIRYTIGQRRGLGLSLPAPLYVKYKDPRTNTVVLAPEKELYQDQLTAVDFNWISIQQPAEGTAIRVTAKPRYRAPEADAWAVAAADGQVLIRFDQPQRAITPGQTVVLYDKERVIGGGTIAFAGKNAPDVTRNA